MTGTQKATRDDTRDVTPVEEQTRPITPLPIGSAPLKTAGWKLPEEHEVTGVCARVKCPIPGGETRLRRSINVGSSWRSSPSAAPAGTLSLSDVVTSQVLCVGSDHPPRSARFHVEQWCGQREPCREADSQG